MWEAIESNKRRSWMLIGLMGALLVGLGFAIGCAVDPQFGGFVGAGGALVVWFVLVLVAFFGGDSILLSSAGAREIQKQDAPQLWNVIEEMTIASGLGTMPKVYVIDNNLPNAFAVGRDPEAAAVAVTTGLLRRLDRDELQGVVAHEISHVQNLDVRFMTLASVMVGAIVLISDGFLRALWYGGRGRRSSSRGGGQAQLVMLVVALVAAVVAPIAAQMLYFACSRRREYLADACAARYTRYPAGLASALEKIASNARRGIKGGRGAKVNRSLAPLYIINPLQSRGAVGLLSTHPPTEVRVAILRAMAGGAAYQDYQAAFDKVVGKEEKCLSQRALADKQDVPIREATPQAKKQAAMERAREAVDLIDRLADFLFILCACGVRIKVPPGLKRDSVPCPRCGTIHPVPAVEVARKRDEKPGKPKGPMKYRRKGTTWESFKCSCGKTVQLSPAFSAPQVQCPGCKREIEITG